MAQNPVTTPDAFDLSGGAVGCVLIHGFTGSPAEMRLLGEYLNARGFSVSGPLLAGHGTRPEDLNRTRWQDWVASAEKALLQLRAQCSTVFVGGLSMGALVAVHLAIMYPDVAGIALYAPALAIANKYLPLLPLARHIIKQWPKEASTDFTDPEAAGRIWHYPSYPTAGVYELLKFQKVVRAELKDVRVPAIVFYSTRDSSIAPTAGQLTFEGLGSADKELVVLHNSGHVLIVDSERESIFARTYGFFVARAAGAR